MNSQSAVHRPRSTLHGKRNSLIGIAIAALLLSSFVQRRNESRRVAENLTAANPSSKEALEAGLLALGGFRGLLADMLWVRALGQQDAGRYYELKLICDMIQRLQPTFVQVHVFQADNMSYNLAYRSETCEDKWYWIRSGLQTLEKGNERNERNYGLWFQLGYQYFDRLSDGKLYDKATGQDCRGLRMSELPRIDDLSDELRKHPFSEPDKWRKGRARNDENFRFAAYYFFQALQTKTELNPLRTERVFGNCLDHLGHFRSKDIPEEQRKWDDWGSEEWWKSLVERNQRRGLAGEVSAPQNLRFTMLLQMDLYDRRMNSLRAANQEDEARGSEKELLAAYRRFQGYFPDDKRLLFQVLLEFRNEAEKNARYRGNLEMK